MKKILLLAAIMMLSANAFAQNEVGKFSIMPKVGLNIANVTDWTHSKARYVQVAGVEAEYQFTELISASAGLLYSVQGAKRKEGGETETIEANYINVPVTANVYVLKGLAVKLGLQPGFNIRDKYKTKTEIGGVKTITKADADLKSFDLALPVGVSYEFNDIVVDARYNWGLTKMWKHGDPKNSVFQFTVGYKFHL